MQIRPERSDDIPAIRRINELAFDGPAEARLVDVLREAASPFLSFVAVLDDEVVGHILFTPATIESEESTHAILGLAPMSVLPEHQGKGIGSKLVEHGLNECARLGHEIVIVLGHEHFYPRFGFVPASDHGITCEYDVPREIFMVAGLRPGALDGCHGLARYHPAFANL